MLCYASIRTRLWTSSKWLVRRLTSRVNHQRILLLYLWCLAQWRFMNAISKRRRPSCSLFRTVWISTSWWRSTSPAAMETPPSLTVFTTITLDCLLKASGISTVNFTYFISRYEHAIGMIGNVIEFYDTDRMFPVYGFGACPSNSPVVNHCFALNMNEFNPEVPGVNGIMDIYHTMMPTLRFSGPTFFAPVLSKAATWE